MRLTLELADDLVPAQLVLVEDQWIHLSTAIFAPIGDTLILRFAMPGRRVQARLEVVVQAFTPSCSGPDMVYRTLIRHGDPQQVDVLAGRFRPNTTPERSPTDPVVAARFPGAPLTLSLTDAQAYVHAWTTGMKNGLLHIQTPGSIGESTELRLLLFDGHVVRIPATIVGDGLVKLHMKRVLKRKLEALAADAFDDVAPAAEIPQLDEHGEVFAMPEDDEVTESVFPLPDAEIYELHPEADDVFAMPAFEDEEDDIETEIPA